MVTWEWKPLRKWPDVYYHFFERSGKDPELALVLQHVVAGAELWSDNPKARLMVLGFEEEVPPVLLQPDGLRRVARALERARTGRWRIECCAFDEAQVLKFRTYPLRPRPALTPLGEIPLFVSHLWVDDFRKDLQRWWSRKIAFAEKLEVEEDLPHEVWWLEEIGISPMRVIERWPDLSRVDFMVFEPNHLDTLRDTNTIHGEEASFAFDWLSHEVQKHLGMPCELRLVRWPTGQTETIEGLALGSEPDKKAMEQLCGKASRCRSEPELRFFWAAVEAHLPLEPGFQTIGYELDFAYPDLRIGVEIDGDEWHSEYSQRERDYTRDRKLQGEGWKVLRYTARQVLNDPASCVRDVKKNLRASVFRFRQQLGM